MRSPLEAPAAWALGAAAAVAAFLAALPWLVRPFWWLVLAPRYRVRRVGLQNVPRTGPVLLVVNHVTWIDGFFVVAALPRRMKALANADYVSLRPVRWLARRAGIIPVPATGPRAQRAAIEAARAALDAGDAVAIFPEAQLSRNGLTGPFYRGLEVILAHREHVPVVPVFLDNLWGSVFSHRGGRFFAGWPRGLRRTVVVAFGPAVPAPVTAFAARQAVLETGVRAFEARPAGLPPFAEAADPDLPRWEHPELGTLAVSTPDYDRDGIRQVGRKPGTVGQAAPGVALRAVDGRGEPLAADAEGAIQVLLPGRPDWVDTGQVGRVDREGFVRLG